MCLQCTPTQLANYLFRLKGIVRDRTIGTRVKKSLGTPRVLPSAFSTRNCNWLFRRASWPHFRARLTKIYSYGPRCMPLNGYWRMSLRKPQLLWRPTPLWSCNGRYTSFPTVMKLRTILLSNSALVASLPARAAG